MDDNTAASIRWILVAVILIAGAILHADMATLFVGLVGGISIPTSQVQNHFSNVLNGGSNE